MLNKLVLSVVVGVVVTLGCILLGEILVGLDVSIAVIVGGFLRTYGAVIGILSALWYFFKGSF